MKDWPWRKYYDDKGIEGDKVVPRLKLNNNKFRHFL